MIALKESLSPEKLCTCTGRFFIAEAEQVTPDTHLSPSKKGFNKVNARLFTCLSLISGRRSQDIDRRFMVRLMAVRLTAQHTGRFSSATRPSGPEPTFI